MTGKFWIFPYQWMFMISCFLGKSLPTHVWPNKTVGIENVPRRSLQQVLDTSPMWGRLALASSILPSSFSLTREPQELPGRSQILCHLLRMRPSQPNTLLPGHSIGSTHFPYLIDSLTSCEGGRESWVGRSQFPPSCVGNWFLTWELMW